VRTYYKSGCVFRSKVNESRGIPLLPSINSKERDLWETSSVVKDAVKAVVRSLTRVCGSKAKRNMQMMLGINDGTAPRSLCMLRNESTKEK
jgi:hypothetical protein